MRHAEDVLGDIAGRFRIGNKEINSLVAVAVVVVVTQRN